MPNHDQVLDSLRSERDQARDTAIALAEADDFDPTSDTFVALEARSASLDSQIERLVNLYGARDQADALDGRLSRATSRTDQRDQAAPAQSWGETFTRSEVFTQYHGRGTSARLLVEDVQTRALPTGVADFIAAGFTGGKTVVDTTHFGVPTPLIDTMPNITVSSNALELVTWEKKAGGAAIVPEKGVKPPIEWGPVVTSSTLDTIAGYTQLTRQLMEDFTAVRSLIDTELRREVLIREEAEAAAALAAATLPTADGAGDLMAAIRVGIAEVQAAGYSPNAALINPADWAALDVALIGGTLLGPTIQSTYWGLKLISNPNQPAGTVTVGDFAAGVQHYVRSGVSLYVTDSHADTFLSNVFTLLAERRSKTVVTRPAALVEVTAGTAPVARSATAGKQASTMDGLPTVADVRAWVGLTTAQVSDADLGAILDAETAIQQRICELPADEPGATYPLPLARALYRRVQCHLARKNLPLGMVGGDAMEWSPVSLQTWDAEVSRLESSYLIPVVA